MKLRGVWGLGLLVLVGGCGTATGAPGAAGPRVSGYSVHTDTLPPDARAETLPATPRTPYGRISVAPEVTAITEGPCPKGGLRIMPSEVDGAMGLRADSLTVTNCGAKSLTVSGYPQVRVLDEDGKAYAVTVHQGLSITGDGGIEDPAPTTFTLKPGAQALSTLVWRNLVTRSDVEAVTGDTLEVAPGKGALPQSVPLKVDLGNTGKLDVLAWQPAPPR